MAMHIAGDVPKCSLQERGVEVGRLEPEPEYDSDKFDAIEERMFLGHADASHAELNRRPAVMRESGNPLCAPLEPRGCIWTPPKLPAKVSINKRIKR